MSVKDLRHHTTEPKLTERVYFPERYLLLLKGLSVEFRNADKTIQALDKIDLGIKEREKVAIVGETGSGKSVLLLALLRLLPANAQISGRIYYKGKDILEVTDDSMCQIRGCEIAYVPQGTGNALNPVLEIGSQVAEPLRVHSGLKKGPALERAVILLDQMGIEEAEQRIFDYPYQYSGGMKERALVAMALAGEADLILADEPTKGLDWGKREEILKIFQGLDSRTILTVTHDLWFAERFAQRVVVMYASRIVEVAPQETFFVRPLHPYSQALLAAQPSRGLQAMTGYAPIRAEHTELGCLFRSRCNKAFQRCWEEPPLFKQDGHEIRCWLYAS
ncbi:MAG: ABC transporter ATP-binding protein [Deltaproteobacteria bacterium]|nr:ABC transporter ATP-binding protein [Deltaproteobacteria bacterium]